MKALLLAVPLLLLSGCSDGPKDASFLILEYTVTAVGDADREANPGPHCATAYVEGDRARVEHDTVEELDGDVAIYVNPSVQGFVTTGSDGWATGLPADISFVQYSTGEDPWVTIDAEPSGNGWASVTVDGFEVDLPHNWTRDGQGYHIQAQLRDGPDSYTTWVMQNCA